MNVDVAVIPAAGRGTRMKAATRVVPKALLPVVDRPALQWVLEEAVAAGVAELIVVVSPGVDDLIFSHFEGMGGLDRLGEFQGIRITWVVQDRPLGSGPRRAAGARCGGRTALPLPAGRQHHARSGCPASRRWRPPPTDGR